MVITGCLGSGLEKGIIGKDGKQRIVGARPDGEFASFGYGTKDQSAPIINVVFV